MNDDIDHRTVPQLFAALSADLRLLLTETIGAAPVVALKIATRRTRERMTANLNALEQKVRHAVGGQSRDGAASGQIRLLTATSAVATVRRLRAMPLKTAVAIGVVAAAVIAMRARLRER